MKIINETIKTTQIVLILMILSFTALNANALTIFSETFDDNSNGWTEDSNWDVDGGVYRFTNPTDFFHNAYSDISFGLVDAADLGTGSYTISYDVRFIDPWVGFWAGLYWEDDSGDPTHFMTFHNGMEYSMTRLVQANVGGVIGGHPTVTPYTVDTWYHLDLSIDAGYATLFLDGVNVGENSIPLFDMDRLGFLVHRANVEFDNILITSSGNPVPEPTTIILLGTGLLGLAGARRKFRR